MTPEEEIPQDQKIILDAIACLEECKDFVKPKENLHHLSMYISVNENIIALAHLLRKMAIATV
jgi:hypothetical protein